MSEDITKKDITKLSTRLEGLDEKHLRKLDKGLKDLLEFSQYGAEDAEVLFRQVSNSAAFAVPFKVFTALLQSNPITIQAIKDLVEILKDPAFKRTLGLVGGQINAIIGPIIAAAKTILAAITAIKLILEFFLDPAKLIKLVQILYPEGVTVPTAPVEFVGPFWWWPPSWF